MYLTSYGLYTMLDVFFRGASTSILDQFNMVIVTDAVTPTAASENFSDFTEIANGSGYTTGGIVIAKSAVGFPTLTKSDAGSPARTIIVVKDMPFAASGTWPVSGNPARWQLLLDNHATPASRKIIAYQTLNSNRTMVNGDTLNVNGVTARFRIA